MSASKYYQVSALQLFFMAILTGVIAGGILTINTIAKEYLLLPIVTVDKEEKCIEVVNFRNGEAFTCNDVGVILRKFRTKIN